MGLYFGKVVFNPVFFIPSCPLLHCTDIIEVGIGICTLPFYSLTTVAVSHFITVQSFFVYTSVAVPNDDTFALTDKAWRLFPTVLSV